MLVVYFKSLKFSIYSVLIMSALYYSIMDVSRVIPSIQACAHAALNIEWLDVPYFLFHKRRLRQSLGILIHHGYIMLCLNLLFQTKVTYLILTNCIVLALHRMVLNSPFAFYKPLVMFSETLQFSITGLSNVFWASRTLLKQYDLFAMVLMALHLFYVPLVILNVLRITGVHVSLVLYYQLRQDDYPTGKTICNC